MIFGKGFVFHSDHEGYSLTFFGLGSHCSVSIPNTAYVPIRFQTVSYADMENGMPMSHATKLEHEFLTVDQVA